MTVSGAQGDTMIWFQLESRGRALGVSRVPLVDFRVALDAYVLFVLRLQGLEAAPDTCVR